MSDIEKNEEFPLSSNLLSRTPNDELKCPMCKEITSEKMVVCERCSIRSHKKCVGLTDDDVSQQWTCKRCIKEAIGLDNSVLNGSKTSKKSKNEEKLKLVEENYRQQQELAQKYRREEEQRFSEYLKVKLAILEEDDDSPNEESSAKTQLTNEHHVEKWIRQNKSSATVLEPSQRESGFGYNSTTAPKSFIQHNSQAPLDMSHNTNLIKSNHLSKMCVPYYQQEQINKQGTLD